MNLPTKILDLVISTIKNLRELKGSTPREILRYISYIYNVPSAMARRQVYITYLLIFKHGTCEDEAYLYIHEDTWICAVTQVQSVLKRGVAYGILKKTGDSYSLPTDSEIARMEVAVQEIGLLDSYRQRKVQRCRSSKTRRGRNVKRARKVVCRCRGKSAQKKFRRCGSRSCKRKRVRCRCRSSNDVKTVDEKPSTKYNLDSYKSTGSD